MASGNPSRASDDPTRAMYTDVATDQSSSDATFGTGTASSESGSGGVTDKVSDTVQGVAEQAKEQASHLTDQAKEKASSRLDEQKDKAAQSLGSVAQAFTQVGDQLRSENPSIAQFADTAAQRIQQFSEDLSTQDVTDLVHRVERYARQQPAVFFAGAFALGFIGARFLKSSAPENDQEYSRFSTGYQGYQGYQGYSGYGNTGGYRTGYGSTGYGASGYGTTGYGTAGYNPTDYGTTGYSGASAYAGSNYGTGSTMAEGPTSFGTSETSQAGSTTESKPITRSTYSPYSGDATNTPDTEG